RRCADHIFVFTQIDEERIGRRIDRLQPAENLRRRRVAALIEGLARNHFEEVATLEALLGALDKTGIFAGIVIAARKLTLRWLEGLHWRRPVQTMRGRTAAGKFITI